MWRRRIHVNFRGVLTSGKGERKTGLGKLMWPIVHLVKDKCLLHYSLHFYIYLPQFKNFRLFKKCSEFHFWDGSMRSSVDPLNQQGRCESYKTPAKVSGNCPKGTWQRKKHLFKKTYCNMVRTMSLWHLNHDPSLPPTLSFDHRSSAPGGAARTQFPAPPSSRFKVVVSPWEGQAVSSTCHSCVGGSSRPSPDSVICWKDAHSSAGAQSYHGWDLLRGKARKANSAKGVGMGGGSPSGNRRRLPRVLSQQSRAGHNSCPLQHVRGAASQGSS